MGQTHGGYKLVDQKEWFIISSYGTKRKSTHDYKIMKQIKFFLEVFHGVALR